MNLPYIVIGAKQVSWTFAFKSAAAIVALSILVHLIHLPALTDDKLLISVFGGFFLGAGIGFSIRVGAVIDGTEVLALYVNRKTSLTVGDFIAVFNVVLFSAAALLVDVETAMYSMLTYFAASKTVDFIIIGIEEYIGVTIISRSAKEVKQAVTQNLGRGVTVYKAESGYGKNGMTAHGCRAMVATLSNEVGIWNADAILSIRRHQHRCIQIRRGTTIEFHKKTDA